jgi:hypothetical protein
MKHLQPILCITFLVAVSRLLAATDMSAKRLMPDTVVLNDGTQLRGMIVKSDAKTLVLQERMKEVEIPKNQIRRIIDQADTLVYFADIADPATLPPWRMIVQDFRLDDNIRHFREIPATTIDNGYLRNIPYLSFRINKRVEMNVYGNPENPVCIEFGIYERNKEKITRFMKIIRAYLAGILTSRQEVAAIYSLPESGGRAKSGHFVFEVTPPDAPEAYGGWWISIYDPKRLEGARLPEAEYRKVTLPFHEVNTSSGTLRPDRALMHDQFLYPTTKGWKGLVTDLKGFYRDRMGELKLITVPPVPASSPSPHSP